MKVLAVFALFFLAAATAASHQADPPDDSFGNVRSNSSDGKNTKQNAGQQNQNPSTSPASQNPKQSSETNEEWDLPDAPKPNTPNESSPCPGGSGKPCALLAGRAYFPDLLHSTEHDRSWADAMKHKSMIISSILLIGTTVLDIEGTEHCLHNNSCQEENPIFGRKPSRPRAYSTAMSVNAFSIYCMGMAKKYGHGNPVIAASVIVSAVHAFFGMSGFHQDAVAKSKAK